MRQLLPGLRCVAASVRLFTRLLTLLRLLTFFVVLFWLGSVLRFIWVEALVL